METRILVCLLITLCGLAKVHTEKKEANLEPDKFDPAHAMQDVNDKLQTLLVDNVLEWQQTYIYSYLIRNISNNLLSTKLKQEHDLVQIAVEVARKKGKEKAHCLEENKEMLHVFYEDMKAKTNHCIDVSINKYGESYVTTGKVKDAGRKAIRKIKDISRECVLNVYHKSECTAAGMRIARQSVESFYEQIKLHPAYRRTIFDDITDRCADCILEKLMAGMDKLNSIKLISRTCIEDDE